MKLLYLDVDDGGRNTKMRSLFALLAVGLLSVGVAACGDASKSTVSTSRVTSSDTTVAGATPTGATATTRASFRGDEDDDDSPRTATPGDSSKDNDSDFDNDYEQEKGYRDRDDGSVVAYGHKANSTDKRAITALAKRYYRAAAAEDGATACTLIYSTFAESIPEDYGQGPGPPYARGKTCAVVMSKVFEHFHNQLSGSFFVTGVRVNGHQGRVLLGSSTQPASFIRVKREHDVWKIYQLIGEPLP
jgi:hypothetical protein